MIGRGGERDAGIKKRDAAEEDRKKKIEGI